MDGRCLSRIRPTGDISARRLAWLPIQIGRSLGRGWRMTAEDAGVESALARRFVPPGGSGDQPPLAEVGGPGGGVGSLPAAPCQGSCSRRVGKPESESRRCARACGDECLPAAVMRRARPQKARALRNRPELAPGSCGHETGDDSQVDAKPERRSCRCRSVNRGCR